MFDILSITGNASTTNTLIILVLLAIAYIGLFIPYVPDFFIFTCAILTLYFSNIITNELPWYFWGVLFFFLAFFIAIDFLIYKYIKKSSQDLSMNYKRSVIVALLGLIFGSPMLAFVIGPLAIFAAPFLAIVADECWLRNKDFKNSCKIAFRIILSKAPMIFIKFITMSAILVGGAILLFADISKEAKAIPFKEMTINELMDVTKNRFQEIAKEIDEIENTEAINKTLATDLSRDLEDIGLNLQMLKDFSTVVATEGNTKQNMINYKGTSAEELNIVLPKLAADLRRVDAVFEKGYEKNRNEFESYLVNLNAKRLNALEELNKKFNINNKSNNKPKILKFNIKDGNYDYKVTYKKNGYLITISSVIK